MTTSYKVKVNHDVLRWAREKFSGHSISSVVNKINLKTVSDQTIISWENGEVDPSYAQIKKLAKIYKIPIVVFFLPAPPEGLEPNKELRTLPPNYSDNIPPEINFIIRKGMARVSDIAELSRGGSNKVIELRSKLRDIKIEGAKKENTIKCSKIVRKILGVTVAEQTKWKSSEDAFKQWRERIQEAGIWVFKEAFHNNDYCGFYLDDESFPVIYINNSIPPNRQIFTLFHELGHFIIHKGGVDFRQNVENIFEGVYRKDEVFCNAFAGEFLVPNEDFMSNNVIHSVSTDSISNEFINELADKYKISREVILRKLKDNKFITQEFYENKNKEWEKERKNKDKNIGKKKGGGDYYSTQAVYLGNKYLQLAFSNYYGGRIDECQLSDFLEIKVRNLQRIEDRFIRSQK